MPARPEGYYAKKHIPATIISLLKRYHTMISAHTTMKLPGVYSHKIQLAQFNAKATSSGKARYNLHKNQYGSYLC